MKSRVKKGSKKIAEQQVSTLDSPLSTPVRTMFSVRQLVRMP